MDTRPQVRLMKRWEPERRAAPRRCQRRPDQPTANITASRQVAIPVCRRFPRDIPDMYARKSSHDVHETAAIAPRARIDGFDADNSLSPTRERRGYTSGLVRERSPVEN